MLFVVCLFFFWCLFCLFVVVYFFVALSYTSSLRVAATVTPSLRDPWHLSFMILHQAQALGPSLGSAHSGRSGLARPRPGSFCLLVAVCFAFVFVFCFLFFVSYVFLFFVCFLFLLL